MSGKENNQTKETVCGIRSAEPEHWTCFEMPGAQRSSLGASDKFPALSVTRIPLKVSKGTYCLCNVDATQLQKSGLTTHIPPVLKMSPKEGAAGTSTDNGSICSASVLNDG